MNVDLEKITRKIVNDCLRVKKGDRFHITCGDPVYYDFCQQIALRAIEAQAYPFITAGSDYISLARLRQSEDYLRKPPEFSSAIMDVIDVRLAVGFQADPALFKHVPPEKFAAAAKGAEDLSAKFENRNNGKTTYRFASFLFPTRQAAEEYGVDFEEYEQMIWNAIDVDYNCMLKDGKRLAEILEKVDDIHITSPLGADLQLSIKGRRICIDDGVYSQKDMEDGEYMMNLPAGEVCIAPVEDSAEGVAVFSYNIMHGKPLKNLKLRFEKGKIKSIEGEEGAEYYESVMKGHTGASDSIAELGIGLNPNVSIITGNLALDEKIRGTIHIATGDNRPMGGRQESSFHWDLVMQKPTVKADGKIIMDDGKLKI